MESGTLAHRPFAELLAARHGSKVGSRLVTSSLSSSFESADMSERGAFRGGRGGGRGGDRGGRGGGRGGAQSGGAAGQSERPKKENILDLSKYMDKQLTVKFSGGREGESSIGCRSEKIRRHGRVVYSAKSRGRSHPLTDWIVIGTLKGYDQLMNLVLDEVKEALTGTSNNPTSISVRY